MTQMQSAEEKLRLKKVWTDQAIQQALSSQWDEAVKTNLNILELFPTEPDAFNRLGKAHSELGQYAEAREAYSQTLKYSPNNTIAKKNLDRLAAIQETATPQKGVGRINPLHSIGETGKSGVTQLVNLAPVSTLVKLSTGDVVDLEVRSRSLLVKTSSGEQIGQVEPRLTNRLIGLIHDGNRYSASIKLVDKGVVQLRIVEEYQHPSNSNKVSFPGAGTGDTIRAYTKESMLRYDRDDDEDMTNEDEYYDGGDDGEEMSEMDFDGTVESEE